MPLVVQPNGTVLDGPIPNGGTTVLVLNNGLIQEAFVKTGQDELSFPSLIPSDKTYTPTNNPVLQGGVSVVIGVVTLDNLVREFN